MSASVLVLSLLLGTPQGPAQTPPSPPPQQSGEREPTPRQKVKEAAELVLVKANTKENLQRALALYEEALKSRTLDKKEEALVLTDMARAELRLGDLASKKKAKMAHYEKGKSYAKKARTADPEHADAYFWEAANLAVIGRTRGIVNSLFMIDDLKKLLYKALELDPNHHYARETIGSIYHAVPGMLGGDDDEAEKNFKEVLRRDPHFTPTMVTYGEFLLDDGREEEARKMFERCDKEKRSSVPHDWRKFNRPTARRHLRELNR